MPLTPFSSSHSHPPPPFTFHTFDLLLLLELLQLVGDLVLELGGGRSVGAAELEDPLHQRVLGVVLEVGRVRVQPHHDGQPQ